MKKGIVIVLLILGLVTVIVACGTETGPTSTPPLVPTPTAVPVEGEPLFDFQLPPNEVLDQEIPGSYSLAKKAAYYILRVIGQEGGIYTDHVWVDPAFGGTPEDMPDLGLWILNPGDEVEFGEFKEQATQAFVDLLEPNLGPNGLDPHPLTIRLAAVRAELNGKKVSSWADILPRYSDKWQQTDFNWNFTQELDLTAEDLQINWPDPTPEVTGEKERG